MKPKFPRLASISMLIALWVLIIPTHSILARSPETNSVPSGLLQTAFVRPQLAVKTYRTNPVTIYYGQDFKLIVKIKNEGGAPAANVQVAFTSSDFVPLKNGGVTIIGDLGADRSLNVEQSMTAAKYVAGIVTVTMSISYTDTTGAAYTDVFTLNLSASGSLASGPTATPTGVKSSQLVITDYSASVDPLQPGEQFSLKMTVQNTGNANAQRVTMIVGGGSSGTSGGETPQPGGVSGGSGEFTNFAPVGASNVQSLGDLAAGDKTQASQNLIVNVSTNPGAYPMRITFSYLNDKAEVINDEQVITLLVYSLPNLEVNFYRPPDPFFVGQPGALPLQVVNLGRRLSVLGTMKVTSANGLVENGTSLIGSLDAGGYFILDSMFIPEQSGTMDLEITIDYTDDFNQPRTITRTVEIEVMEGFEEEPILDPSLDPSLNGGEGMPVATDETTLQKIWRFVLGLFGLDSAPPNNFPDGGIIEPAEPLKGPVPGSGKG